jgi:hypothetical protein
MKNLALLSAMVIGSGFLAATPSSAQVQFGIGPDGPSVRIGRDDDRVIERRRIVRRNYVDDGRLVTGSTQRCRTVTIREENDFGDTVVRRRRTCR